MIRKAVVWTVWLGILGLGLARGARKQTGGRTSGVQWAEQWAERVERIMRGQAGMCE